MPLQDGKYVAPTFVDGTAPALSASEMNAMAGAVQGAVEYDRALSLTDTQKNQALNNIDALKKSTQSLTDTQKSQVLGNIGAVSYNSQSLNATQGKQACTNVGAVSYASSQSLTTAQKTQARSNVGATAASGVNVSVAANAWSGSAAPYTASVSVSGVTSTNHIVVGIASSASATQYAAFADGQVICSAQGSGTITLKAFGDKPTTAVPISVLILT